MKSSFRDYYSWTFEDFFNELKRIGYGPDGICRRGALNWYRQSGSLFARDYRKKYFSKETFCSVCSGNHKIEVDHIIPIFAGGLNEEKNMQFLCQICHRKKTANDYKLYKRVTK